MKQIYLILLLFSSVTFGQSWKTISLNEDIKFDFPPVYVEKDSANLKTFVAQTPEGIFSVSRTIEKNTHVLSWDKVGIVEIYKGFQQHLLETGGGQLVSDEVVEFLDVKTAKFVIRKLENDEYQTRYYLVFYFKGHVYIFEFTEIGNAPSNIDWNRKFYNEISIANKKTEPVEVINTVKLQDKKAFSKLLLIPLALVVVIAIVLAFVIWRRHKTDKKYTNTDF